MRLECLRRVEVMAVAAAPAERGSFCALESAEVDAALFQRLQLVDGIVGADDTDDAHLGEMARRRRKKSRRAAENVVRSPERRLHGIERYGANNQNRDSALSRLG